MGLQLPDGCTVVHELEFAGRTVLVKRAGASCFSKLVGVSDGVRTRIPNPGRAEKPHPSMTKGRGPRSSPPRKGCASLYEDELKERGTSSISVLTFEACVLHTP